MEYITFKLIQRTQRSKKVKLDMNNKFILSIFILVIFFTDFIYGAYNNIIFNVVPWSNHQAAMSLTFDDGWLSQRSNAIPEMNKKGIRGTFYLSGKQGNPSFLWNYTNFKTEWSNATHIYGHEIGNHSLNHPDLTTLSGSSLTNEILDWKTQLETDLNILVTSFGWPYCKSDAESISVVAAGHFIGRSCGSGFKVSFNSEPTNWHII